LKYCRVTESTSICHFF